MDARHLSGQIRGHGRIAIPVAPDPGTPAQEGGHARRPGAGSAVIAGQGAVIRRGAVFARIGLRGPRRRAVGQAGPVERAIEGPVDARHGAEDRLVEEGQGGSDLVDRVGREAPDGRGAPQDADLLTQPAPDLGVVRGTEPGIVELLDEP